jgi:Zn-dependent peptidase ImmA (M78 family)
VKNEIMDLENVRAEAEKIARAYNPDGLSPFPFEKITAANVDVAIAVSKNLPENVSGVIAYLSSESKYAILVNENKHVNRRHFTIAHELGHYFLHKEEIQKELFVDGDNVLEGGAMLFRKDDQPATQFEIEANNFAASLIMPEGLVKRAWGKLKDVDDCARVFSVSVEAMSIRLSRLGLIH